MQMIRSGSNFEEVAQVMSRRSINSVKVRYKQLSEGSQVAAISPPRSAVFSNAASPPVQVGPYPPPIMSQPQVESSIDFALNSTLIEPGTKRLSAVFGEFEDEHTVKAPKLEVF